MPCREVSFTGRIDDQIRLSADQQESIETLRTLELETIQWNNEEGPADTAPQPFKVPRDCYARFPETIDTELCRSRFLCRCQVAGHNHLNPELIHGHLVVFDEDTFCVVFLEIHSASFFRRVEEDLFALNYGDVGVAVP